MTRNTTWALGLMMISATSCVGDDDGGGGGGNVAIENVPQQLAQAMCATVDRCFGDAADIFLSDCQGSFQKQFAQSTLPEWQAAVAGGKTTYHGDKVAGCVAAVRAAGCDFEAIFSTAAVRTACEGVFTGAVAVGGQCQSLVECAPGNYCAIGSSCPGMCTARKASDATCEDTEECQDGLTCDGGRCRAPEPAGGACTNADDCNIPYLCRMADGASSGTCTALADTFTEASGAACDPLKGRLCTGGLACTLQGGTSLMNLQWKCEAKVASGAACRVGLPGQCPTNEVCDANLMLFQFTGNCVALPSDGQPCRESDMFSPVCATGLECGDGTCVRPRDLGAACTENTQCNSDQCRGGKCVASECVDGA